MFVIAGLTVAGLSGWPKSSGPVSTTGTGVTEGDGLFSTAGSGVTSAETAAAGGSDPELDESGIVRGHGNRPDDVRPRLEPDRRSAGDTENRRKADRRRPGRFRSQFVDLCVMPLFSSLSGSVVSQRYSMLLRIGQIFRTAMKVDSACRLGATPRVRWQSRYSPFSSHGAFAKCHNGRQPHKRAGAEYSAKPERQGYW